MGGAVNHGWLLARALRTPGNTLALDSEGWTALIAMARAEQMIGTLAYRLEDVQAPDADGFKDEYLTETCIQLIWEARHALLTGVSIGSN